MGDDQSTGRVFAALGKPGVPLDDFGFADPESAKRLRQAKAAAAAEAHRALVDVVIGRLSALQNLVHQCVEQDGGEGPVRAQGIGLLSDYRKGIIAYRAIGCIGCDDMGQHQLLECVDAVLQFVELALIERGHDGESPAAVGPDLPAPTPNTPHRLSEGEE